MSDIDEKITKTKISYRFDAFLMYLLQDVSGRSSAEIVNFFYELATTAAKVSFEVKKGNGGIDKRINDYFPGTSVPFYMRLKGRRNSGRRWDYNTRQYIEEGPCFRCSAEITFPESYVHIPESDLEAISVGIMENKLLGGEEVQMRKFERPATYSPKPLKALMDEFAGRPKEEKNKKKADEAQ